MSNKIKEAFDEIKASDEIKEKTKSYIYQNINSKQKSFAYNRLITSLAIIIIIIFSSTYVFYTPISAITIDEDQTIKLSINRFNKVVKVEMGNDNLFKNVDLKYLSYEDAIVKLLNTETINDDEVAITVISDDENCKNEMMSNLEKHIAKHGHKASCHGANYEDANIAQEMDIPLSKYYMYQEIKEYDKDFDYQKLNDMSMKEIRNYLYEISGKSVENKNDGHHGHHHK